MIKVRSITHRAEPLKKSEGMKKDRTVLEGLGLMVRPDGIQLDGLT